MIPSILFNGQEVLLCQRNSGPSNHLKVDVLLFGSNPCEALSAGLILDGTYLP